MLIPHPFYTFFATTFRKTLRASGLGIIIISVFGTNLSADTADLIIFSKDRPLQLQALLESITLHVTGLEHVAVLYATSAPQFSAAYETLAAQFPNVRWVQQDPINKRADFAPLLRNIFENLPAPYLMFAVDDMIVTNKIDLSECIEALKRTHAYGCYLRLGKDTDYCYAYNQPMRIPMLTYAGSQFYTWDLRTGDKCWGYPHTVDMTLYPRELVRHAIMTFGHTSPNVFEAWWSGKQVSSGTKGLCYATSRVINIPLNLVQQDYTQNRCTRRYRIEDLLNLFLQGWRINVEAFYKFKHNSPHVDTDIPLTKTITDQKEISPC